MKSEVSEQWQRPRATPQERAAWVRRFERSGLTRLEFGERHGLGWSTLDRWRAKESSVLARTPPARREVSLSPLLGPPQWAAGVQHPDGRIVRLSAVALPRVEALPASPPC